MSDARPDKWFLSYQARDARRRSRQDEALGQSVEVFFARGDEPDLALRGRHRKRRTGIAAQRSAGLRGCKALATGTRTRREKGNCSIKISERETGGTKQGTAARRMEKGPAEAKRKKTTQLRTTSMPSQEGAKAAKRSSGAPPPRARERQPSPARTRRGTPQLFRQSQSVRRL